jgi:hypothetical protein
MKKWNRVMELVAIAITVIVVIANLHHLLVSATKNSPARHAAKPAAKADLTFHVGLLPGMDIKVFLADN